MTRLRIAALGSSFAAGPSIQPIENVAAGRSARNYAHQLAEKLDTDLTDLSVSGATLLNLLNERQYAALQFFDPQLDHLPADTDIITLTCGGNDLGYIGSLTYDSLMAYLEFADSATQSIPSCPALNLQQLTARMTAVLNKIHDTAPKAKVFLVEYLSIIGSNTRPWIDIPVNEGQMTHYVELAALLARAYNEAARSCPWAEVVPVAERSKAHALGSKENWVEGFNLKMLTYGPATYHPNLAGHTAIAEMLHRRIV